MKYLLLFLLSNCGMYHHIKGVDGTQVYIGPDFEKVAEFCDNRYGKGTQDAEDCFEDYRNYTNVTVKLDLSELEEFCSSDNVVDKDSCIEDILEIFKLLGNYHE